MYSTPNQDIDVGSLGKEGKSIYGGMSRKSQILSNVLVVFAIALVVAVIFAFIGVLIYANKTQDASSKVIQNANDSDGEPVVQKVCMEEDCIIIARDILTSMDLSKDPCEDFYKFACGKYDQHNQISINHGKHSMYSSMHNVMKASLKEILEQPLKKGDIEIYTMARQFYNSCILQEANKKMYENSMLVIEDSLGAWPANVGKWDPPYLYSWEKQVLGLMKLGMFLQFTVVLDVTNNSRNTIVLNVTPFSYKIHNKSNECNANQSADELNLQITKKAMTNVPFEKSKFEKTTINGIKSASPDVDWNTLLSIFPKSVYLNDNDSVVVESWDHLKHIFAVLVNASNRDVQNFLFDYANMQVMKNVDKHLKASPWWKICVEQTDKFFPEILSNKFAKKHFNKEKINLVQNMSHEIREVLISKIKKANWLDDATRERALSKIRKMRADVGQPDEFRYDEDLFQTYKKITLKETEYPENVKKLAEMRAQYNLGSLRNINRRDKWFSQNNINAMYVPFQNSINLPTAIFEMPLMSLKVPAYLNYARIGQWIGHEMTHGFDAAGYHFDELGNLENWMSNTSRAKLHLKYSCFETQINNTKDIETGCWLNGKLNQGEIIADTGGAKLAYRVFLKWMSKNPSVPSLPGLPKYSPKQLFFIAMATQECAIYTKEKRIKILETDPHPIKEYRINFPLKNFAEFGDVFNCPKTAKMHLQDRCEMW